MTSVVSKTSTRHYGASGYSSTGLRLTGRQLSSDEHLAVNTLGEPPWNDCLCATSCGL